MAIDTRPLIGEGVDLRGQAASGATQRMVCGLNSKFLVVRPSPPSGPGPSSWPPVRRCPCGLRLRVGAPGQWWNRPTTADPPRRLRYRERTRLPSPPLRSAHRYRPLTSGNAAPTPSANDRTPPADPATANRYGTASRYLPTPFGAHSTDDRDAPRTPATTAQPSPKTRLRSHLRAP